MHDPPVAVHWHCPVALQVSPVGHVPQLPPQPLGPHALPPQLGVQTHCPFTQLSPPGHVPQLPPQPSGPHTLPAQLGAQAHCPFTQLPPPGQVPQLPPQPSDPHARPVQLGVHPPPQTPFEPQLSPDGHEPHVPPQPSGPHDLPEHCGVHESPVGWPVSTLGPPSVPPASAQKLRGPALSQWPDPLLHAPRAEVRPSTAMAASAVMLVGQAKRIVFVTAAPLLSRGAPACGSVPCAFQQDADQRFAPTRDGRNVKGAPGSTTDRRRRDEASSPAPRPESPPHPGPESRRARDASAPYLPFDAEVEAEVPCAGAPWTFAFATAAAFVSTVGGTGVGPMPKARMTGLSLP